MQVTNQIRERDNVIEKKDGKIKSLQDEIDRRKFLENKVQTYVKTLCM